MKNLSIPAVAIAVFESLSISGCVKEKIDDVRGDTGNAVTTTVAISEGELLLMDAQKFEREGDFQHAAEAYKNIDYKIKAKKMLLMVAQGLEQKGDFSGAAYAYEEAGDPFKAQEMSVRLAREFKDRGNSWEAVWADEEAGISGVDAQQMWLMVAQESEQKGVFWRAAMAYHKAGDKVKAQEMRLRDDARMSNGNVYEAEVGNDSCSCRD